MFGIRRLFQGSECLRGMGGELRAVEAMEYSNMRCVHDPYVLHAAKSWIWMRGLNFAGPLVFVGKPGMACIRLSSIQILLTLHSAFVHVA